MPLLIDLYRHQQWADAEHWRAIQAHPGAVDDPAIRERLHHIHHVQHAFLGVVTNSGFDPFNPPAFEQAGGLKAWAREYHDAVIPLIGNLAAVEVERAVTIPWFENPPLTISVDEALTQCALHSHYHRGQNATRLRELGGTPPLTDFIV